MKSRKLIMLLGAGLLLGCEQANVREEPAETEPGAIPGTEAGAADLFVAEATGGAQLLFVAQEDTRPEGARSGAVFVPMATFSVERDGIPNEFPPAESMAAQLEAAGVQGDRFVIVGAPIPAGIHGGGDPGRPGGRRRGAGNGRNAHRRAGPCSST